MTLPLGTAGESVVRSRARRADATENLTLLYIFLTPFQFLMFGPSLFPKHESGFGLRMSLADLVFPILLLAFLLSRRADKSTHRSHTGLLFFALLTVVTVGWFQSIAYWGSVNLFATGKFVGLIYVIVLAAVLIDVLRDSYIWHRAIDALALSGVVAAAIGLVGWTVWRFGTENYMVETDRLTSMMFGDPNIFASLMAVTLIIMMASGFWGPPRSRLLWLTGATVVLVALLLTQSRSGYMCAAVGVAVMAVWLKPSAGFFRVVSLIVLITTIGWASYALAGSPNVSGISGNARFTTETLATRIEFWKQGVAEIKNDVLPGIGIATFQQINVNKEGFARSHNTYLTMLLGFGLPGVVALTLLCAGIVRVVRKARWRLKPADDLRLAGIASALIGMAVFAFWIDAFYQRHLWILIAIALASANLARRPIRETRSDGIEVSKLLMSESHR